MEIKRTKEKGITLVALIITIIILIILAAITIKVATDFDIVKVGVKGTENYAKAQVDEEREFENIEGMVSSTIDKINDLQNGGSQEEGGVKPIIEAKVTKTDGSDLTSGEIKKGLTINITNIAEYGSNYIIEVKDQKGKTLTKENNIIGNLAGQASYIITRTGKYTIIVKGTKEGIERTLSEEINIEIVKETTVAQFSKANGVIDIVWLDNNNNVIDKPISPKEYLGGLTGIKYDGTEWVVADINNHNDEWYKYEAQKINEEGTSRWANARSSDSNAYFVWIPRYAYKITYFDTETNANEYRVNNNSTKGIIGYSTIEGMEDASSDVPKIVEGTKPVNVTGKVNTAKYAEYIPHPAFEFGGVKAGIWVGKFESSGSKMAVKIIPDVEDLRDIKVGDMFEASQGVKVTYGLTGDSHMMKNIEWGAVAYLTESKYGMNGKEVSINSSGYKIGGGNYKNNISQSTTNNIYGIYDMNGTAWEYVTGILSGKLSNGNYYNFTQIDSKYYDTYTDYNACKGIKGDAIYETSTSYSGSTSWHKDYSIFTNTTSPVFIRGRTLLWDRKFRDI